MRSGLVPQTAMALNNHEDDAVETAVAHGRSRKEGRSVVAAPPIRGCSARPASSDRSLNAGAERSRADQGRARSRGAGPLSRTPNLVEPGAWIKARETVRDRVKARQPSGEPSSPYGGRRRTAGRSRRPRRRAREAQQPAVPSPDRSASRPRCEAQQPEAGRPRFASIAIASTIPGRRPIGPPANPSPIHDPRASTRHRPHWDGGVARPAVAVIGCRGSRRPES